MHIHILLTLKKDKDIIKLVLKKIALSLSTEEMRLELRIMNISSLKTSSKPFLEVCLWDNIDDVITSERTHLLIKLLAKFQSTGRTASRRIQFLLYLCRFFPDLHDLTIIPKFTKLFYNRLLSV
jgi:hypothetical protein